MSTAGFIFCVVLLFAGLIFSFSFICHFVITIIVVVIHLCSATFQPLVTLNPSEETAISATYSHKDFKAKLAVSPFEQPAADLSVCVQRDNFFFGGAAGLKYVDNNVDISAYDFGVGYKNAGAAAALTVKNKLSKYQFSFFHKHSDVISFAATYDGKISGESAADVEFGGSYDVDSDTTVYSKLSFSNGSTASSKFYFNVDHRLNSSAKLGITSVLPADLNGAPKFGLNLSLGL